MAWTNEQQAAIDSRKQTLLLSAAAGTSAATHRLESMQASGDAALRTR